MIVRGAPAIGVTGAYGMVIAAHEKENEIRAASGNKDQQGRDVPQNTLSVEDLLSTLHGAKKMLDEARPTAVNLMWATQRMIHFTEKTLLTNGTTSDTESSRKNVFDSVDVSRGLMEQKGKSNDDPLSTASPPELSSHSFVPILLQEANRLAAEDIRVNLRMAKYGASIVPIFKDRATNILHHCNTGALATVDWGK